jgi:HAD superfamily phosphoserine phosphatase-like hydrolase
MDRTVTDRPSWLPWLLFWARAEASWRLGFLLVLPGLVALYPLLGRARLKEAMQRMFMGRRVPEGRVAARAEAFAERFGRRHERASALRQMAADRADGFTILLATASSEFYVAALARRWGIGEVVATRNAREMGQLTWRIAGENCYGAAKRRMVDAWLGGRVPARVRVYSDHVSDLPTFALADEPVAISPSRALRRVAARRGWPIRDG